MVKTLLVGCVLLVAGLAVPVGALQSQANLASACGEGLPVAMDANLAAMDCGCTFVSDKRGDALAPEVDLLGLCVDATRSTLTITLLNAAAPLPGDRLPGGYPAYDVAFEVRAIKADGKVASAFVAVNARAAYADTDPSSLGPVWSYGLQGRVVPSAGQEPGSRSVPVTFTAKSGELQWAVDRGAFIASFPTVVSAERAWLLSAFVGTSGFVTDPLAEAALRWVMPDSEYDSVKRQSQDRAPDEGASGSMKIPASGPPAKISGAAFVPVRRDYVGNDGSMNELAALCGRIGTTIGGVCLDYPTIPGGKARLKVTDASGRLMGAYFTGPMGQGWFCGEWSGPVPTSAGRVVVMIDGPGVVTWCGKGSGPGTTGVVELSVTK